MPKERWYGKKKGAYLGYYNIGIEFDKMTKEHEKILSDHIDVNYKEVDQDKG